MMAAQLKALAYARVSTPEQAESDLSIPAQLKAIRSYAKSNNIIILDEYVDEGISAYHDERKRISFNAMIQHAMDDSSISRILVHDATRFFRNKYRSSAIKGDLIKHGVTVIPVSSPYDPTTIDGAWRESIDETMAMTSSMANAFHTTKAMTENASKRDPESGYCYKNGGIPPYGYMQHRVYLGKDRRGKDNIKLLWDINPETAPILRKIVVDWRVGEGLSYKHIREHLNDMQIPSPKGEVWGQSTIVEMLRENRLYQYTGIYYWNKEDHKNPGKRYKDKSEWIEVPNAHPAILTIDEVEAALAVAKVRQPRTPAARSYDSPWLLTGLNLEGKPFFTCAECGHNMIGVNHSSRHLGKYVCGRHHYKGNAGCSNNMKINNVVIEQKLLKRIEEIFGTTNAIDELVKSLNSRLGEELDSFNMILGSIERELAEVNQQIELTFKAYSQGLDPELCNERLSNLKAKRNKLAICLVDTKKDKPQNLKLDPEKARKYFEDLREVYKTGSNEQKRMLFKTYIKKMVFDPANNKVNITFYSNYLAENIKRGNDLPRNISVGAAGGT